MYFLIKSWYRCYFCTVERESSSKEHSFVKLSIREKCLGSLTGCRPMYDMALGTLPHYIHLEDVRINYDKRKCIIIGMHANSLRGNRQMDIRRRVVDPVPKRDIYSIMYILFIDRKSVKYVIFISKGYLQNIWHHKGIYLSFWR